MTGDFNEWTRVTSRYTYEDDATTNMFIVYISYTDSDYRLALLKEKGSHLN